jgi:nitrous oxidase accessory protein NosD
MSPDPSDGEPRRPRAATEPVSAPLGQVTPGPASALDHDSEPDLIAGRYRVLGKLGEGGMGTVFRALDTQLDRIVALKMLPARSIADSDAVARLRREAKALAKLSHPGIVQAFDAGEEDGRHFLVMEYVEGTDLLRVLDKSGPIPPTLAADYIHQAASAMQHAHERGLVHRDLKPSNLLLASRGRIKVLDLGLARFLQDQLGDAARTAEGLGMGTPDYMAPEQFRDARGADPRSDVYALGCTLYHLLAGQVPFPGSSLREKCAAHEQREPVPLEQACAGAPAGLILTVRRMMAKRPADRFQTAREVAEALAPYVAGSSETVPRMAETCTWHGGQLSVAEARSSAGMKRARFVAGLAIAAAMVLSIVLLVSRRAALPWVGTSPRGIETRIPAPASNVLTVAQNGKAQYRTIAEALENVSPGQRILVCDNATYRERIVIDRPQQSSITLEASLHATIVTSDRGVQALLVQDVPGVRIDGLRFREEGVQGVMAFVAASGKVPGLVLRRLDFSGQRDVGGILLRSPRIAPSDPPLIVEECTFATGENAIQLEEQPGRTTDSLKVGVASIRNNRIRCAKNGILLWGALSRVHVMGNRISNCEGCGIEFRDWGRGEEEIVVANNTIFDSNDGIRFLERTAEKNVAIHPGGVEIRNNLISGSGGGGDITYRILTGDGWKYGDPGIFTSRWSFGHNARDYTGNVPSAPSDLALDVGSINWRNSHRDDWLRPPKDSPLATQGAGRDDPSLPTYVGAVTPKNVTTWNWDKTWQMRSGLLTVSKDGRAPFETIKEALSAARPGMTVRILDDATYDETLLIDQPQRQRGIVLESPRHATVVHQREHPFALLIQDVPELQVRGLRLKDTSSAEGFTSLVSIRGRAPGVVLRELDFKSTSPRSAGVLAQNLPYDRNARPLVIEDCTAQVGNTAVVVQGALEEGPDAVRTGGVLVRRNRLYGSMVGVLIDGAVENVHIAANAIWHCYQAGIQIQKWNLRNSRILIANNTVFDCDTALQFLDEAKKPAYQKDSIELRNNILSASSGLAARYVQVPQGARTGATGDPAVLLAAWRCDHNWRDPSGNIPLAPNDHLLGQPRMNWFDATRPDWLRPPSGPGLADQGAGRQDPSLPTYVGAMPPENVQAWDWDKTWSARK